MCQQAAGTQGPDQRAQTPIKSMLVYDVLSALHVGHDVLPRRTAGSGGVQVSSPWQA